MPEVAQVVFEDRELRVFDVLENPEQAAEEMIVATPLFVRIKPRPRLVGDMADHQATVVWLTTGEVRRAFTSEEEMKEGET